MRIRRIPRISPSMVVACLALTVALAGTSVAATQLLPANSVGSTQLRSGAVTNTKLRNQAVTNTKIRRNTITSSRIMNGTLLRADFKPGELTAGEPGAPGSPGISGLQRVDAVTDSSSSGSRAVSVNCPSGKRVIGGGARVTGSGANRVSITEDFPDSDGSKWNARANEVVGTSATWALQAYALCATVQ